jgi:hypothetical protein
MISTLQSSEIKENMRNIKAFFLMMAKSYQSGIQFPAREKIIFERHLQYGNFCNAMQSTILRKVEALCLNREQICIRKEVTTSIDPCRSSV